MTVEIISRPISTKECCWTQQGSNPGPPDYQSDAHQAQPPRQAHPALKKLRGHNAFALLIHGPICLYVHLLHFLVGPIIDKWVSVRFLKFPIWVPYRKFVGPYLFLFWLTYL